MSIYEIGLSKSNILITESSMDFQRIDLLHACLQATKGFFEKFLSLPVSHLKYISIFSFTQVANAMVVLHKLTMFECPGWDAKYVRGILNFSSVLDQLISWFEVINEGAPVPPGEQVEGEHSHVAKKLMRLKAWHEQELARAGHGPSIPQPFLEGDIVMGGEDFNFLNDSWVEEFLGPLAYQPNLILA